MGFHRSIGSVYLIFWVNLKSTYEFSEHVATCFGCECFVSFVGVWGLRICSSSFCINNVERWFGCCIFFRCILRWLSRIVDMLWLEAVLEAGC